MSKTKLTVILRPRNGGDVVRVTRQINPRKTVLSQLVRVCKEARVHERKLRLVDYVVKTH